MEALMRRVPLYRLSNCFKIIRIGSFNGRYHHSRPYNSMSFPKKPLVTPDCLPELPLAPRYPCPFIMAADMETYILPLYRIGWGISRVLNHPSNSTRRPATQLSKTVILPCDMAKILAADIMGTIVEQENHHPTFNQLDHGALNIHIHTHTALAPVGRQNIDDQKIFTRRRPGITHRDIRFAIMVEHLLLDYVHGRKLIDYPYFVGFPQPLDIDSLHNFRVPPLEIQDSAER